MTLKEYYDLLAYIDQYHSFDKLEGKGIKYVTHTFDLRTLAIHYIKLSDGLSEDKAFSITNINKDRDLKEWIYNWLDDNIIWSISDDKRVNTCDRCCDGCKKKKVCEIQCKNLGHIECKDCAYV